MVRSVFSKDAFITPTKSSDSGGGRHNTLGNTADAHCSAALRVTGAPGVLVCGAARLVLHSTERGAQPSPPWGLSSIVLPSYLLTALSSLPK